MFLKLFTHPSELKLFLSKLKSKIFFNQLLFSNFPVLFDNRKYDFINKNGQFDKLQNLLDNRFENRANDNLNNQAFNLSEENECDNFRSDLSTKNSSSFSDESKKQMSGNKNLSIYENFSNINPNAKKMERDFIKTITPELPPTFNLATYANHLDIIKQMIKLNVRLYDIEKNRESVKFLLKLNFKNDVIPYLNFLIKCGLKKEEIGDFLSENFDILKENILNLEKRIAYCKKMGFTKNEIISMLIEYPTFINYPIEYVDELMGFIQAYLKIRPFFVRLILLNCPKLLAIKSYKMLLEEKKFALIELCGFETNQMKQIIIYNPKVLLRKKDGITTSFEYIFDNITQNYELITRFPGILCVSGRILKERDLYLKKLGRAQYDPTIPLYVPLSAFTMEEDNFLRRFCKTNEDDFFKFIKTL